QSRERVVKALLPILGTAQESTKVSQATSALHDRAFLRLDAKGSGRMLAMSEDSIHARVTVDRSEGFGERLLGAMIDRAHEMPPQLIAPLVAEEIAAIGGR